MIPYPYNDLSTICHRWTIKDDSGHISIHVHNRKARVVLLKRPGIHYDKLTRLWQLLCEQADQNGWVIHYRVPDSEQDKAVWLVLRELGFVETPTDDERYLFRPYRRNNTPHNETLRKDSL